MGPKRLAVVQSSYIPWKGYFDLINLVDEFVLFDDVQFTRRDWRSRNRIKTPRGAQWLSVPVLSKGRRLQRIDETVVSEPDWGVAHWKAIAQNYAKARHFKDYKDRFERIFLGCRETLLSRINFLLIEEVCGVLGIKTRLTWSSQYPRTSKDKSERLVEFCRATGAGEYLSGPTARAYFDEGPFREAGVAVKWMDYSGYPEYEQLFPPFVHEVSVLDLIFHAGPDAPKYMKSFSGWRP
jgi:hypothetical protein